MKPFQKINHFPGMYQIARKNYLARNLNRMQKQFPADFQFFPKTWLLPHQLEDLKHYSAANPGANFIVKPEALSQGKGIFITKRFDQIDMTEHLVVQKYIKHPYLIDDYKFDFRVYILVTNVQPLRIFAFRDGLARFATEKYKLKAYNNPFIHLTNYAINKDNANFEADDKADATTGHKRTLESIFVKLARDGIDIERLKAQMRDIFVKTLISVQPDLYHHYRMSQPSDIYNNMCFEILGFDILIDKTGKPWLLEVNHAPSFNCDTALDSEVKKNLVHDTFNLLNATVQEKNEIITVLKDIHEKRVIGINKTNKQAFYAQR
jgi:tubulin polyglutamylase TTLL6/13